MKYFTLILTALMFLIALKMQAHPTGNMITVGNNILWSYINPLDDPNHHACIMISEEGSGPKVLLQSEHVASDYMLCHRQNVIYIIERRHIQATQDFEIRILKTNVDRDPEVIWNWFEDDWRIGEGGFFMPSDEQIIFVRYPEVYSLKRGEKPAVYFEFNQPVKRIRAAENNQFLLLSDENCYLLRQNGTIVKQWNKLIDDGVENAPLNRNQIFDADYNNGKLLLAYWGNRSFELIDESGKRQTIEQQTEPLVPHWVAFLGNEMLLFSSKLIFDGSTPKPNLLLLKSPNNKKLIWSNP